MKDASKVCYFDVFIHAHICLPILDNAPDRISDGFQNMFLLSYRITMNRGVGLHPCVTLCLALKKEIGMYIKGILRGNVKNEKAVIKKIGFQG